MVLHPYFVNEQTKGENQVNSPGLVTVSAWARIKNQVYLTDFRTCVLNILIGMLFVFNVFLQVLSITWFQYFGVSGFVEYYVYSINSISYSLYLLEYPRSN